MKNEGLVAVIMDSKIISKIYLASKSPRRRELLAMMGVDFELLEIDIPEEVYPGENFRDYSTRICNEKAEAAWEHVLANNLAMMPVLTADTEVVFDNVVFGKPIDYQDAFRMWRTLAGNHHLVITTVTLKYGEFHKTVSSESRVYFDQMTDEDIHAYLATGDYQDKSGAYGIHTFAGQFIQKIDGCFYSIMGLPLNTVKHLLAELARYAA